MSTLRPSSTALADRSGKPATMHTTPTRVLRRILLGLVALTAVFAAIGATAQAAPVLSVDVDHAHGTYNNSEPGREIAHSDQIFNYKFTFANSGSAGIVVGDVLQCTTGLFTNTPLSYNIQWMSNGVDIAGAVSTVAPGGTASYTVVAADAGKSVQCRVKANNAVNSTMNVSTAVVVDPQPGTAPVTQPATLSTITGNYNNAGAVLTCPQGTWGGTPLSYSFQWFRNGVSLGSANGGSTNQYTVQSADLPGVIQCVVTATNASGVPISAALNVKPSIAPNAAPTGYPAPNISAANRPKAGVGGGTLSITLPTGVEPVSIGVTPPIDTGSGWTCVTTTNPITCTRADAPVATTGYPPIKLNVRQYSTAPETLTTTAAVSGGGSATATGEDTFTPAPTRRLGVSTFTTKVIDQGGADYTQAGGHPYSANATFKINSNTNANGVEDPAQDFKTVYTDLPPGFIGNPAAVTATCTSAQLVDRDCPVNSQVGVAQIGIFRTSPTQVGVYNMKTQPGHAADFAFNAQNVGIIHVTASVRSDGDYGVTLKAADATQNVQLSSVSLTFWGVPSDASHDGERYLCDPGGLFSTCVGGHASTAPRNAFLTNPTVCDDNPPTTTLRINSWQEPDRVVTASAESPLVTGCDQLVFDPTISVTPKTTQADAPSGYDVHVGVPQSLDPDVLGTPPLKDAEVTLPKGVSLNPGVADGLDGCSDGQFGIDSIEPATCPASSKIGSVHIATPVLPENDDADYITGGVNYQLSGSIYLRKPDAGATRTDLYSILVDIEDAQTGITVKLRGNVVPDAETGQLTARFVDNPQLPFTDFLLEFKGGDRASLANPMECGAAKTVSTLSSWGGPTGTPTSTFNVDWDGAGGACPDTLPFGPTFSAGTVNPLAGAFSPFTMTINRGDRQQIMSGIDVDMPSGLLGMIGSVPLCADDQAAAGTCGEESRIGSTTVSSGAGNKPFSLPGKVFVAGPYKGQPFSLSIVVRAIAGPFDLGTVVVRAPIMVDAANAKLRVPSDALPTILEGVPLRLKMINILLDRPQFMFNPTNCNPQQVGANLSSLQGAVASVSSPYQASGCENLPFNPSFKAKSDGRLKFKNGAALKVDITQQPGEAAIKSVAVTLPKQLPSRLIPTINNACVQAVFEENPANCPEDSYIGTSTAKTPVFPEPLTGPVYVIARAKEVPQIVVVLHGQGIAKGIDLKLYGDIIIDSGGGRSKSTFHMVPDVPISSFSMDLPAGPHSILDAPSYDVCQGPLKMGVSIVAQNGKRQDTNDTVKVENCPKIPGPKVLKAWVTKKGIAVKTLVPSLGRLAVSGTGLTAVARKAVKRGIITANLPYTPAMRKAVQKGARTLKVKVWFQPANAAKPSTKNITVKVKQRKAKKK